MEAFLLPKEINPEAWAATFPGVQAFILTLLPLCDRVAELKGLLGASVRFTTLSKYFTRSVTLAWLLEQLV